VIAQSGFEYEANITQVFPPTITGAKIETAPSKEFSSEEIKDIQINAALNVKRVVESKFYANDPEKMRDPYRIMSFQETKTIWHPVGI
jgi:hypothetical protein